MKENRAQIYAIQYYQTLFDNAVKILKTQLLLRLHYTQHYKKHLRKTTQIQIKCI